MSQDIPCHMTSFCGKDLNGQAVTLPQGAPGSPCLLFFAFWRSQQAQVDAWLEACSPQIQAQADLSYYEVPVIRRGTALFRWWVQLGMKSGVRDFERRRHSVTHHTDPEAFRRLYGMPTAGQVYVLLVTREGRILWRAEGQPTNEAIRELAAALETPPR